MFCRQFLLSPGIEVQLHSADVGKGNTQTVSHHSVDHSHIHLIAHRETAQRRPSTPAHRPLVGNGLRLAVIIHKHKIGIITRTDETAPVYTVNQCRVVTHLLYHRVYIEHALLSHLEHQCKRELNHRHA